MQSRDGYLWLATGDGLVRFDGVRFKVFGLEDGLSGVDVSSLFEDDKGILWIGTYGSGLCRIEAGTIETVPASSERPPGSDTIVCMDEDATGRLWVGTTGGLRFYQNKKLEEDPAFSSLSRVPIRCLCHSRDGKAMWIGTGTWGLLKYADGRLENCPGPTDHEKVVPQCLLADRQNRLWVSIGNGMVLCQETNQWRIYNQSNGLPFAYISCLAEDNEGTIWAGSLDAGLYHFDGKRFNILTQKDGLSADDFRSLLCDREGNLWAGTRTGGLDRLSRRKFIVFSAAEGLTNDYTRAVAQTPDGSIWVATIGGSLYRGGLSGFEPFRPDPIVYFYASVETVLAAPDGSLWWGGSSSLLHWQNDRLADCITNEPWIQNAYVNALQDDLHGGMWIGTTGGRLVHLRNGQFTEFPRSFTRAAITSLAVQPDGTLWVGTIASGLIRIPADGSQAQFITNGLPKRSAVRTLRLDGDGTLWIGTAGRGLAVWRNRKIFTFTASQGFLPTTVSQIVEDDRGNLWLGCNRGIFKVQKKDLIDCADGKLPFVHCHSFGINDGMPTEECSGGFCPAGLKTQSGLICISTVKGLVFLDPDKLADEEPPPTVLLEELLVGGKPQSPVSSLGGQNSGQPPRRLLIPPGRRNNVELHYTAISFSAPEKIEFRYRLEPLDSGWTEAGSQRVVNYQHLPPGNFIFHVQACTADGVWSDRDTSLTLTVQPFLWERMSFRAMGVVALAGMFGGTLTLALRRRYKRRLARLQAFNAIERERLRISKDMHDQVGGVLTQVSQITDLGLNEIENTALVKKRLERIGDRARVAVQALDEIVWATNPQNDNLVSFAEYVSRFSDEFFEYTNVRCWQEMPSTLPALPLRAEVRHNVFLALREALNNVLKHAKCTEVWLKMKLEQGWVILEIEDNGAGFKIAETPGGGYGLDNFQARLADCGGRAEIASTPGEGTRVRFIFPAKS